MKKIRIIKGFSAVEVLVFIIIIAIIAAIAIPKLLESKRQSKSKSNFNESH